MSNSTTNERRGPDGLTKTERGSLYQAENYTVRDLSDGWELTNGPATFFAVRGNNPGELLVTSNTLGVHSVVNGCCRCPDSERAQGQGRCCKHSAVWYAVANHQGRKRLARAAAPKAATPAPVTRALVVDPTIYEVALAA